jgi:hypothetical protein
MTGFPEQSVGVTHGDSERLHQVTVSGLFQVSDRAPAGSNRSRALTTAQTMEESTWLLCAPFCILA